MGAPKDAQINIRDQSDPIKPTPEASAGGRRNWLLPAGLGLLLGLLVAGLCIALPVGLNSRNKQQPVLLSGSNPSSSSPQGTTRTYYLAADETDWDFAPEGKNLCKSQPFSGTALLYTEQGVGTKYKKAVFHQYTDDTFTKAKERSAEDIHMGLLGPPMHAEVGDTLHVVLRNNLQFPINLVAGGVKMDGDAAVNPGDTYTAKWYVPESAGPASADDPSTHFWIYRSAADPTRDTQAGLAGPLVIARPGGLGANDKPQDVDKEIFLMLQVFDETNSPYYDDNAAAHEKALAELNEADLAESNKKYSINGFMYCNLPGLNMTVGDRVRWYVSSLGSEDAIHTAHWHGIVFKQNGHHMDQAVIQSSSLMVMDAYTDNPGTWLFHCHLSDHIHGGMMALFTITGKAPQVQLNGQTRKYFVAAEEEVWDYVPFGGELCGGSKVNFSTNAQKYVTPGPDRVGSKYLKARYVEYTDATFTQKKRRAPEWEHLGVLGPMLRGVVGDTLLVTFKNKLSNNSVSIHSHGMLYDKDSEGSPYSDGLPLAPGDKVAPGKTVTYKWLVPERAGPGPNDLSSVLWMYHSHVDESADPLAGLVGGIIVTTPDNANATDASPQDVPREYVLAFYIMDENNGILAAKNFQRYLAKNITGNATALEELIANPDFQESNLHHSINGFMYCNLPGLQFTQGESARLYFMALGSSSDMHTPNSAETQLFINGHKKQAVALLPGAMMAVDTTPMVSGKGLLQCHVYDHISAGMSAIYDVKNLGILVAPTDAPVRTYYIAAELVPWDYAPLGFDGCTGQPWNDISRGFTVTTNETMGSKYQKALFREYTDATFKTLKPQPAERGFLGPMMRVETGDKLVVHFLNKLPFDSSVQVFGGLAPFDNSTQYQVNLAQPGVPAPTVIPASMRSNSSTGRKLLMEPVHAATRSLQQQITATQAEAEAVVAQSVENIYSLGAVKPNGTFKYEWFVPDEAGPASADGVSVVYGYVSGVDHIKHINAGLVGPLVVYKQGKLADPGVDLEVPVLFNVQNELQSQLFETNYQWQQNSTKLKIDQSATSFPESNLMHQINGHVYCNGPTLQLSVGDRVRWYVMGFGSEVDMHSPVFEGQETSYAGEPTYSVGVMPANTFTVDMVANSTGTWNYYCNILDHIWAGMSARMVVS